jgi:hypothetical protein
MGAGSSDFSERVERMPLPEISLLKSALSLVGEGFYIFPLAPGSKDQPIFKDPHTKATRDIVQVKEWWQQNPNYNIGITMSKFVDDDYTLLGVDIDDKNGKEGSNELLKLEFECGELPLTFEQKTASGNSRHYVFKVKTKCKQGADTLGRGIDTRAGNGYLVGSGSRVGNGAYSSTSRPVVAAPEWLVSRLSQATEPVRSPLKAHPRIDLKLAKIAKERALKYLETSAPIGEAGSRNDTAYKVACKLKDLGVDPLTCEGLMGEHWACSPMLDPPELSHVVNSAYQYGKDPVGSAAAELEFDEIEDDSVHPFEKLNREFAFVVAGGGSHILWEKKDHRGKNCLEHLNITAFHQKLAAETLSLGDGKTKPLTDLWMQSKVRRSYDGICFMPGLKAPDRFYNLWQGFQYKPLEDGEKPSAEAEQSLKAFLEHAKTNVCGGNKELTRWLIGYFAHLVQKPWEKPLVALVFRGAKGVGKNALIERVGALLGSHFLLTSNRRYLVSNFNGHLENLLLFTLDEAFWSGDKQAEGTLKDLITGANHVVEHKGKESYSVENCTRMVIIGNEEWLVPASQDERRFAVFDVGDGRKQDRNYFQAMREGMERGGYRLLLRYLLDYPLEGIDFNAAPATLGLLDQKVSSLSPIHQWWKDCLHNGQIVGSEFGGDWPGDLDKELLRSAFRRYLKDRQITGRLPDERSFGKLLAKCTPSIDGSKKRREGSELVNVYRLPTLEQARIEFDRFIGHEVVWE